MNIQILRKFQKVFTGALILFGLFLFYQIMRKILGGSWGAEELIIGLLLFNIGATFTLGLTLVETKTETKAELNHLKAQFSALVTDLKAGKLRP